MKFKNNNFPGKKITLGVLNESGILDKFRFHYQPSK